MADKKKSDEKPAENIKSNSPADYKGTDKDVDKSKDKNPDPDKGSQQPLKGKTDEQPEPSNAPDQAPAPDETAQAPVPEASTEAENEQAAGEPEATPSGSHTIVIEGEGQLVFHVDGAVHYLDRGKPIKVTDEELAALDAANVEYKARKK